MIIFPLSTFLISSLAHQECGENDSFDSVTHV